MSNKVIVLMFVLFAIIVFFGSLQTVANIQKTTPNTNAQLPVSVSSVPLSTPTSTPITIVSPTPTPTLTQIQHPGYRVNVRSGDD